MQTAQFLLTLIAIFAAAKLFGELAERLRQPAVLGELLGGVVVGASVLGLVDSHDTTIHLMAELGVILLLFLIGLETDLNKLLSVGAASSAVAVVGVALPFISGYFVGQWFGYPAILSVFLGAALTATSVGITARVLSDLGQLQSQESQIVLGAAVLDDIIGLVILSVVGSLAAGAALSVFQVAKTTVIAFGFVALAIVVGGFFVRLLIQMIARLRVSGALAFSALMFAFALAYLAEEAGSALIVGAFAAGLVLARTDQARQIEREVREIAHFFIPIFFIAVGAAVDLRSLNPFNAEARPYLILGLVLSLVGIIGKVAAGWAAFGKDLRKLVIGVGMIPRGEVGLIFAQMGLAAGILNAGQYSSVALMVMLTTFVAPLALRALLPKGGTPEEFGAVAGLVGDAPFDDDPDSLRGQK